VCTSGSGGVPGLDVDLCVREERSFDYHLPDCGKVDQCEAIFNCTLMQVVVAYRWLMYGFIHHQLYNLGRLRMAATAVHKNEPWPPLLSHLLVHVC
jgi:hypothetical protein